METIGIFVDVQNIYYTTRQAFSRQFNYRAFWEAVTSDRQVLAAFAYAIEPADGKQKGFQQILRDIGFTVMLKPYIRRSDGSAKGDWDVGLTLDLVEWSESVDRVVLASGDGDFDMAIERAKKRFGVETEVYGVQQLTAASLIKSADVFHPIDDQFLM